MNVQGHLGQLVAQSFIGEGSCPLAVTGLFGLSQRNAPKCIKTESRHKFNVSKDGIKYFWKMCDSVIHVLLY